MQLKYAMKISNQVLDDFATGKVGEIYVVYTGFKNTVTHIPTRLKLLPIQIEDERSDPSHSQVLQMCPFPCFLPDK